jgi:aminodeoxyfutalosine synthase
MEAMTAQQLLDTQDLIAVGVAGDEIRRRIHGATTTFARVLEIHVDAPLQSVVPGAQPGEVRIVGVPSSIESALAAVRSAVSLAHDVPVTGFSAVDLAALGDLVDVVRRLKDAGLAAVWHLPLDLATDAGAVARAVAEGGLSINVLSVHKLDDDRRVSLSENAQELAATSAGIKAFAPLPRTMSVSKPTTGYDDVKMVALARTVCTNVRSIQVDWQLYGPKMAQVALTVGADDVDNVSAVDPGVLGTRRSPLEEITRNIRAAGLEPVERDGLFRRGQEMRA